MEKINLSTLRKPAGQVKKQQRVGQGMGSRRGKYSGRGAKGAKSISGYSKMRGFEGGQMPLHRRLPKRGFTNPFRQEYAVVNLGTLEKLTGDSFDAETLMSLGVVKKLGRGLKILAGGELTRKISVKAHAVSGTAIEKIKALGGAVEVLAPPKEVAEPAKPKAAAPAPPPAEAAVKKEAKPKKSK